MTRARGVVKMMGRSFCCRTGWDAITDFLLAADACCETLSLSAVRSVKLFNFYQRMLCTKQLVDIGLDLPHSLHYLIYILFAAKQQLMRYPHRFCICCAL